MPPKFRTSGGPFGRGSYKTTSRWRQVEKQITDAQASGMKQLAQDIEIYLHNTLHRWTGQMAREAFAQVYATQSGIVVRFGSDAEHTYWHEIRYHNQISQTADYWGPKIGEYIRTAMGRVS